MRKVILGVIAVVIVAAGVGGVAYHAYANREIAIPEIEKTWEPVKQAEPIGSDSPRGSVSSDTSTGETDEATELIAVVDSQEEAEEIAELYGISLSSYAFHVAIYTTDRDASEVIAEGEEKGYPTLSRNEENYRLVESNE